MFSGPQLLSPISFFRRGCCHWSHEMCLTHMFWQQVTVLMKHLFFANSHWCHARQLQLPWCQHLNGNGFKANLDVCVFKFFFVMMRLLCWLFFSAHVSAYALCWSLVLICVFMLALRHSGPSGLWQKDDSTSPIPVHNLGSAMPNIKESC